MLVWVGSGDTGGLVEEAAASISVFDHGFTVGDGLFETMKVVDGRVFLWPWHLERLHTSANHLRIALPEDDLLTSIVTGVARQTAAELGGGARVRLTISAGLGPLGSARLQSAPTVVCAASAMPVRTGDARVHMASWPRNERSPLAGVKSTSYAENVLALVEAQASGAGESIFLNTAGALCEGTASNVFVVRAGEVLTPPVEAGLLPGVTRRFVLGLGDDAVPVRESHIAAQEFQTADEVFITSTFQDVRGVCAVDEREIAVGPVTRELQRRFASASAKGEHWS